MVGKYKVITLCGSTRFKKEFLKAQKELTLKGNIVISVGLFGHADEEYGKVITDNIKTMLDDMHKRKIDMADEIFVINKDGYIGNSTKGEIDYAVKTGKKVNYLEENKTSPKETIKPQIILIDENLRLRIPSESQWDLALSWYKNPKALLYSEGIMI